MLPVGVDLGAPRPAPAKAKPPKNAPGSSAAERKQKAEFAIDVPGRWKELETEAVFSRTCDTVGCFLIPAYAIWKYPIVEAIPGLFSKEELRCDSIWVPTAGARDFPDITTRNALAVWSAPVSGLKSIKDIGSPDDVLELVGSAGEVAAAGWESDEPEKNAYVPRFASASSEGGVDYVDVAFDVTTCVVGQCQARFTDVRRVAVRDGRLWVARGTSATRVEEDYLAPMTRLVASFRLA